MSNITGEQVKQLRDKTGAGMMACREALEASKGNIEEAISYLRKKGAATAEKRADRVANQGIIVIKTTNNDKFGVMVEVNCETDFVARGDDFIGFTNHIADVVTRSKSKNVESLLTQQYDEKRKVSDALSDLISKIGEKIEIRRFAIMEASGNSFISSYVHTGSKIGVLLEVESSATPEVKTLSQNIAMQVAAMSPLVISRNQVPKETIDREMDIYLQHAKNEGKTDDIADKIAKKRLEKFFQEVVLLEQNSFLEPGKTIQDLLGTSVKIQRFERYQIG